MYLEGNKHSITRIKGIYIRECERKINSNLPRICAKKT